MTCGATVESCLTWMTNIDPQMLVKKLENLKSLADWQALKKNKGGQMGAKLEASELDSWTELDSGNNTLHGKATPENHHFSSSFGALSSFFCWG